MAQNVRLQQGQVQGNYRRSLKYHTALRKLVNKLLKNFDDDDIPRFCSSVAQYMCN